ncbi:hypothetical protein BVRB_1g006390 [Beta vulgaris subsp. vulgaris]|nr:hypothetical protein BVRB_1g006390 [Beta vulgaris subsp. vulgaris]
MCKVQTKMLKQLLHSSNYQSIEPRDDLTKKCESQS